MLDIFTYGDDVLTKGTEPVTEFDGALKMLTDAMLDSLEEANGIGLAAPQIGLSRSFFVVKVDDGVRRVFINPTIIGTSEKLAHYEEGCLSLPGIWHDIVRPAEVEIQAFDVDGKPFKLKADGILARCILHEYDHLVGKLFVDRLDEEEKEKMVSLYKKKQKRTSKRRRK